MCSKIAMRHTSQAFNYRLKLSIVTTFHGLSGEVEIAFANNKTAPSGRSGAAPTDYASAGTLGENWGASRGVGIYAASTVSFLRSRSLCGAAAQQLTSPSLAPALQSN
jgi:hypothetical protein